LRRETLTKWEERTSEWGVGARKGFRKCDEIVILWTFIQWRRGVISIHLGKGAKRRTNEKKKPLEWTSYLLSDKQQRLKRKTCNLKNETGSVCGPRPLHAKDKRKPKTQGSGEAKNTTSFDQENGAHHEVDRKGVTQCRYRE